MPLSASTSIQPPSPSLWTVHDVATFLNCSTSFVYKAAARGDLPTVRIGALLRFDPVAIRAFAQRCGLPAEPAAGSSPREAAPACSPNESEGKEA